MMRPAFGAILVAVLLAGISAGPAAAEGDERIVVPIENFLPGNTIFYLTVKDSGTLLDLLARAGDSPESLAHRLAGGERVATGSLAVLFEILSGAADGPATLSIHRVTIPGIPSSTPFLVTVSSLRKGDHLKDAGRHLVRGFLGPRYAKTMRNETLMGVPVQHLSGEGGFDLYIARVRGYLLLSSSAVLMGQAVKELQGPSVTTLIYVPEFKQAQEDVKARADGDLDAFLFLRDPMLVPGLTALGVANVCGGVVKTEDGVQDFAIVRGLPDGALAHLRGDAGRRFAWAGQAGSRAWIGATFHPEGVRGFLVALLGDGYDPFLGSLVAAAHGEVEALMPGGSAPVVRVLLKPGAILGDEMGMLEGIHRRVGDVLILSEDPEALANTPVGESLAGGPVRGAALKAPVALVLGALGGAVPELKQKTAWQFVPIVDSKGAPTVHVQCGTSEIGPVQAVIAALFR